LTDKFNTELRINSSLRSLRRSDDVLVLYVTVYGSTVPYRYGIKVQSQTVPYRTVRYTLLNRTVRYRTGTVPYFYTGEWSLVKLH
jgi:hypothetical protein